MGSEEEDEDFDDRPEGEDRWSERGPWAHFTLVRPPGSVFFFLLNRNSRKRDATTADFLGPNEEEMQQR